MCGISAIVTNECSELASIEGMTKALEHRGPDDTGIAMLEEDGVALGMRRLSIVDIEGGHQPMWAPEDRHCLVFNGEIYNSPDLREELITAGHRFRTHHSDTEVIVHGFTQWGVEVFERLNGMFAVALWDRAGRRLVVARDRTGEKPLYIATIPGGYAVASELKALLTCQGVGREIDPVAVEQYLAFDYIIGPRTILQGTRKLPAAHFAQITPDGCSDTRYWVPRFVKADRSPRAWAAELDRLLDDSVRQRLLSDVPVGLFLSGGLDSSSVGYYMRRHSDQVHSFSIGFQEAGYDESDYAALAAEALGTKHHLEMFPQSRIRELIPRVADVLDEPMGDQSIFPTYLLSTFTRQHVKVALGGDGSDELLMGYNSYRPLKLAWMLESVPLAMKVAASVARRAPEQLGGARLRAVAFGRRLNGGPVSRLLSTLGSFDGNAGWVLAPEVRAGLPASPHGEAEDRLMDALNGDLTAADRTVAAYMRGYLQEDILVKVDRAAMAASLEVRSPFLDPRLVDLVLSMPVQLRLHRMTGKAILRRLMRGRLPDAIIDRPKSGFGVPLNQWLRGSLHGLVREYLDPSRLRREGVFDANAVGALVRDHLDGRFDRGHEVWLLLLFGLWRERWLS